MSGARPGSLIPSEVSYKKTDSKLVELDEDGNEVRELPRLSKRTTKHVSFPAEEEQRDSLLVPSPEGNEEEQICLGSMETDTGIQSKPNEEKVYERTVETPGSYKVTARKIVRRLSKRGSNRQKDDKFNTKELLLILCGILLVLSVIIAAAAVVIVIVLQQQDSEAKIRSKQGKHKLISFLPFTMYFSCSHNEKRT